MANCVYLVSAGLVSRNVQKTDHGEPPSFPYVGLLRPRKTVAHLRVRFASELRCYVDRGEKRVQSSDSLVEKGAKRVRILEEEGELRASTATALSRDWNCVRCDPFGKTRWDVPSLSETQRPPGRRRKRGCRLLARRCRESREVGRLLLRRGARGRLG